MNIVLIGMPGSGKTSVGQYLAQRLNLPFVDTDAMIEAADGRTIPEIFEHSGERFFRDLETDMACQAAEVPGAVISTGGGLILRSENMEMLKKTGTVFFLDRPPEVLCGLDHSGRPLMTGGAARVYELYEQRINIYRGHADHIIPDLGAASEEGEAILRLMKEAANA